MTQPLDKPRWIYRFDNFKRAFNEVEKELLGVLEGMSLRMSAIEVEEDPKRFLLNQKAFR